MSLSEDMLLRLCRFRVGRGCFFRGCREYRLAHTPSTIVDIHLVGKPSESSIHDWFYGPARPRPTSPSRTLFSAVRTASPSTFIEQKSMHLYRYQSIPTLVLARKGALQPYIITTLRQGYRVRITYFHLWE